MRGIEKALSNTGCPWPGGAEVAFERTDVAQLGKLYCWGSACVQFVVRLRDGREVFVRADRQVKDDERFLRRLARPIRGWAPGREEGFRTVWGDHQDTATEATAKITLEAIQALQWGGDQIVSEGEGHAQIVVEAHPPNRHHSGQHYTVRRGVGKVSLADSPASALTQVLRRRAVR